MSRSTRPTGACCRPWPPWAAARSATPSCTSRSTSSGSGSPRSRSTSGKASAPSTPTGSLSFVNRAAADLIELPSLDIAIDDPVSDGAPLAPDFLLDPAREAMRTGRSRPGGRRPVPRQERRDHPGRLHGVRRPGRRHAVGCGDRLPRHHRAQGLRGRAAPARPLRQPHRPGQPPAAGGAAGSGAPAVGAGPQDARPDLRGRGPLQEHQRQPRPRDRGRVPRRDRGPAQGRGAQ